MSRMNELSQAVAELRHCGETLISLSDTLKELFSGGDTPIPEPEVQSASAVETPKYALEEVRAVLAQKSNAGHTEEVHALIEKYGASKLSQIDPAKFGALMAEAEAL